MLGVGRAETGATEERFAGTGLVTLALEGAGLVTLGLEDASGLFAAALLESVLGRLSVVLETPSFVVLAAFTPASKDDILLDTPLRVGRFLLAPSPERTVSVSDSPIVDLDLVDTKGGRAGGLLMVFPVVLPRRVDVRAAEEFAAVIEAFVGPVARLVAGLVAVAAAVVFASLTDVLELSVAGVTLPVASLRSIIVVEMVAYP